MTELLTIGEFAGRCGLSRSALRFYDQTALLCPRTVDEDTGYRYYGAGQVQDALLIRRLRTAEIPVELVREFLTADAPRRRELLEAHARGFRARARSVEAAVRELRETLDGEALAVAAPGGERWCTLHAEALRAALAQVAFAMGRGNGRPELGVVWVETREASLRLVTTDSYRLAVRDLVPVALGPDAVRGAIDGARAAELAGRLPAGAQEVVLRQAEGGELSATFDGRSEVVGGSGEGFPDYERILEGLPSGGRVAVAREALVSALRGLQPGPGPVRLSFGEDGLRIAGGAADAEPVGGAWTGDPLTVLLDRSFLAEALAATVGPDVVIEAVDPRRPVTLRSADTGTFSVLTMPVAPDSAG